MLWRGAVMALVCHIVLSGVGSAAEDEAFHEAVEVDIERAVEWAARTGLSALRIAADYHRAEMAKIAADEGSLINDVIYRISCSTQQECERKMEKVQQEMRSRRDEAKRKYEEVRRILERADPAFEEVQRRIKEMKRRIEQVR